MKNVILMTPLNVCMNYKSCVVNFSQILLLNLLKRVLLLYNSPKIIALNEFISLIAIKSTMKSH